MMVTMGGGPPERASLHGGISEGCEEELDGAGGLEGFVGKVAVVEAGDGEHPDEVEEDRGNDDGPIDPDPEAKEAAGVEEDEGEGPLPVDLIGELGGVGGVLAAEVGIEPLAYDSQECLKGTFFRSGRRGHDGRSGKGLFLEALFDDTDHATDDGDLAIDVLARVPEVLMESDLAGVIKADLADSDGVDGLAAAQLGCGEDHGPADIVVGAGAGGVINRDREACHGLCSLKEVGFDFLGAVVGDEGVIEVGSGGVGPSGVLLDVFFISDVLEEVAEGFESRFFLRRAGGRA